MTENAQEDAVPCALVTGASRGLGRAVAGGLADLGWHVVADARSADELSQALLSWPDVEWIAGDVTDPDHRRELASAVARCGGLDLLVNNASTLGPSPLPGLHGYPMAELRDVFETNVLAPLGLTQLLLPALSARSGAVVNLSSDAAVQAYPGWGGYGASKAALDLLTAVLAIEEPTVRMYAFDPGDMRTAMHQLAFPNEDISDRPEPETVVPVLLSLISGRPPSGRFRVADLTVAAAP